MNYIKQNHLSILIILWLVVTALMGSDVSFGANRETSTITNPFSFTQGLTATTVTTSGDATVSGGTLNVTTANTATSTIIGGCFQFYATSTATALKFQASTTPGVMYSQYGACPNL